MHFESPVQLLYLWALAHAREYKLSELFWGVLLVLRVFKIQILGHMVEEEWCERCVSFASGPQSDCSTHFQCPPIPPTCPRSDIGHLSGGYKYCGVLRKDERPEKHARIPPAPRPLPLGLGVGSDLTQLDPGRVGPPSTPRVGPDEPG